MALEDALKAALRDAPRPALPEAVRSAVAEETRRALAGRGDLMALIRQVVAGAVAEMLQGPAGP